MMHVFMAAWWIWGPHSEQLGVTNQKDLIESHVQTSRDSDDSDDNVCVCVCLNGCKCAICIFNGKCKRISYMWVWYILIYLKVTVFVVDFSGIFLFVLCTVCMHMTTHLFPLHTEHPPVWGLASTTMAFLEIGAVRWWKRLMFFSKLLPEPMVRFLLVIFDC